MPTVVGVHVNNPPHKRNQCSPMMCQGEVNSLGHKLYITFVFVLQVTVDSSVRAGQQHRYLWHSWGALTCEG